MCIYIQRSGKRKVKNENDIFPILKKYNFQIIEDNPKTIFEQFKIFQSAKIVLGPHGAGFSNILFCQKNTKIVEFFPKNYYPPHYFYLSGALGLVYYGFIENGDSFETHYSNVGVDLSINPNLLEDFLKSIC